MKLAVKTYVLLSVLAIVMVKCKQNDGGDIKLTTQQKATQQMSVTWGSAEILDSPVPGAESTLSQLTLTFETIENFQPSSFSASGAPDFFSTTSGSSWTWKNNDSVTGIILTNVSGVQEIAVETLTETNLTISFMFDGPTGGRTHGIGEYRVRLTRL